MVNARSAIIVQKYGGDSLRTPTMIRQAAARVLATQAQGCQVVVVVSAMGTTTNKLIRLAERLCPRPPDRELDMLIATGEQASCSLLAMAIQALGGKAVSFTGQQVGIITDHTHTEARIQWIDTSRIKQAMQQGKIVVVAGFQGMTDSFEITTLGRGGSDITAVALAASLHAEVCEKLTTEPGIYAADRHKVPGVRKITDLSYEEMLELTALGMKVLHPRAVECAMKHSVSLHVRSSINFDPGTRIIKENQNMEKTMVTGVTGFEQAKISILDLPDHPGVGATVFAALAAAGINVDVIVMTRTRNRLADLSFTVDRPDAAKGVEILHKMAAQEKFGDVLCEIDIAKISIVGAGMRSHPGVAATMFKALADANINISLVSTSEIKISCIIPEADLEQALKAVCATFDLMTQTV